ncbi:MAG TPA: CRTAC1 family protein [Candidatus Limnocylindrales bacterium]|nr:CRTAC1 family protein [Candidatus Limnocylindrales bacterium]
MAARLSTSFGIALIAVSALAAASGLSGLPALRARGAKDAAQASADAPARPGPIRFEDIAAQAGLNFELRNGAAGEFHQPELMLGGVAALDYNNDGCTDIFFTNGAAMPSLKKTGPEYSNRLFRNNCNGTFTDVTQQAGVAGEGYSMGVAVGDYDNDGYPDIFVAGVNRNFLYHNRGDGTFEDVTAKAHLTGVDPRYGKLWSVAAAWVDVDNDGWLDLVVTNYVQWDPKLEPTCGTKQQPLYCHPDAYHDTPNQLFRNNHDGTFTDITDSSGLGAHLGKGMGVSVADYDGDGLMDIFVANDSVPNFLFHNLGHGKFEEVGLLAGVALDDNGRPVAGMGTDFRDFDNDGRPDLVLTAMINDTYPLFRNSGKAPAFDDVTASSGLALETRTLTGWGIGLFDFDNDGFKDVFTANAHFPALDKFLGTAAALPNSVFRNQGDGHFEDVSKSAGADFQAAGQYRGVAFADFDNDGRVDAVVANVNGPARLFRNVTQNPGHWLALKLTGTRSNRDGIGAKVEVDLANGRKLYNHCTTSVGYASSSEPLVRFGLGPESSARRIEIRWPSGQTQQLRNVPANQILKVREP